MSNEASSAMGEVLHKAVVMVAVGVTTACKTVEDVCPASVAGEFKEICAPINAVLSVGRVEAEVVVGTQTIAGLETTIVSCGGVEDKPVDKFVFATTIVD